MIAMPEAATGGAVTAAYKQIMYKKISFSPYDGHGHICISACI